MKRIIFIPFLTLLLYASWGQTNDLAGAANAFLVLLSDDVRSQAQFKFEDDERFNWHFVPRWRAGVAVHDLTQPQFDAAMNLLKTSLSVQGFKKATDVISLENVLREVENRASDDPYRDPRKYYFSIFGHHPWKSRGAGD